MMVLIVWVAFIVGVLYGARLFIVGIASSVLWERRDG